VDGIDDSSGSFFGKLDLFGINPVTISKKGFDNILVIGNERLLPLLSKIVQLYSKVVSAAKTDETTAYDIGDGFYSN
jgi:hypothetical protein